MKTKEVTGSFKGEKEKVMKGITSGATIMFVFAMLLCRAALGASSKRWDFYVAPDGSDENPDGRQITVQAGDPLVDYCVKTVDTTRYLLIDENGASSTTTEIGFDGLELDDEVDVFGAYEEPVTPDSCIIADTIQKYAPEAP